MKIFIMKYMGMLNLLRIFNFQVYVLNYLFDLPNCSQDFTEQILHVLNGNQYTLIYSVIIIIAIYEFRLTHRTKIICDIIYNMERHV